jgi:hypothetical protein
VCLLIFKVWKKVRYGSFSEARSNYLSVCSVPKVASNHSTTNDRYGAIAALVMNLSFTRFVPVAATTGGQYEIRMTEVDEESGHAQRLLRLRLHMMRNHEPIAVDFFIDVSDDDVDIDLFTILEYHCPSLLAHLPREIAIDVNLLV